MKRNRLLGCATEQTVANTVECTGESSHRRRLFLLRRRKEGSLLEAIKKPSLGKHPSFNLTYQRRIFVIRIEILSYVAIIILSRQHSAHVIVIITNIESSLLNGSSL